MNKENYDSHMIVSFFRKIDLRNNSLMVKYLTRDCIDILVINNWRGVVDAKGNC